MPHWPASLRLPISIQWWNRVFSLETECESCCDPVALPLSTHPCLYAVHWQPVLFPSRSNSTHHPFPIHAPYYKCMYSGNVEVSHAFTQSLHTEFQPIISLVAFTKNINDCISSFVVGTFILRLWTADAGGTFPLPIPPNQMTEWAERQLPTHEPTVLCVEWIKKNTSSIRTTERSCKIWIFARSAAGRRDHLIFYTSTATFIFIFSFSAHTSPHLFLKHVEHFFFLVIASVLSKMVLSDGPHHSRLVASLLFPKHLI